MSSTNNDSEDDDPRVHSSGMSSSGQPRRYELSKSELRKNNKPIMEKKRRARINQCLNELKTLILDALKKDPARHTKLEKADILEMTVRHLQSLHRNSSSSRPLAPTTCPTVEPLSSSSSTAALTAVVVQKFQTGYQECAGEVNRFVDRLDGVDEDIKKRLMSHLDSCVAKMRYVAAAAATVPPPPPPPPPPPHPHVNNSFSLHHRLDQAAAAALAAAASVPLPSGRPVLQQSVLGDLTPTIVSPTVPSSVQLPSIPKIGRLRTSAFTAVHGQLPPPDVGPTPFVYCDEPDVSSTSSWAEDMATAAASLQHPPLDFSMKKTVDGCSNKRPLGDISVNVPTATASSSSHKQSATAASSGDGPTPARVRRPEAVAAAGGPCDGPDSDPNMWRPW
ncbi:PREDICTED: transcription factor HES-1-B-like [Diuraphis noxia]|uniref:transcription factor HES-1-B-like n=1 Tax=Diuraphis noxia TaxID=143948 RepID=UPI0007637619|nr:PREDICTED: transcription factor HES-1-B-like [Diuraphis noxia]